jgi:hypothetical protein
LKKFVLGLMCGIGLTATTAVYAADTIQAYLFPAKFVFNGQDKELDSEYTTLNYNGHAYVPIRFIAENMGATVGYDDELKKITVDYETFDGLNLKDAWLNDFIKVGNLQLYHEDNQTKVVGQVKLKENTATGYQVSCTLNFYDENGEIIGKASEVNIKMDGGQIKTFEAVGNGDFTNYAIATLDAGYAKMGPSAKGFPPGELNIKDANNNVVIGDLLVTNLGTFTRVNGHISILKALDSKDYKASLSFYDEKNELIGTASIEDMDWTSSGGVTTFGAVGKGDFTKYKTVNLTMNHL